MIEIVINPDDIIVDDSYEGPIFDCKDDITSDNIVKLMKWLKNEKKLHLKYCSRLILFIKDH